MAMYHVGLPSCRTVKSIKELWCFNTFPWVLISDLPRSNFKASWPADTTDSTNQENPFKIHLHSFVIMEQFITEMQQGPSS